MNKTDADLKRGYNLLNLSMAILEKQGEQGAIDFYEALNEHDKACMTLAAKEVLGKIAVMFEEVREAFEQIYANATKVDQEFAKLVNSLDANEDES